MRVAVHPTFWRLVAAVRLPRASCRTNPRSEAEAFLEERAASTMHFEVVLGEPLAGR